MAILTLLRCAAVANCAAAALQFPARMALVALHFAVGFVERVFGLRLVIEIGNQKSWLKVTVAALAGSRSVDGKLTSVDIGVAMVAGGADGSRRGSAVQVWLREVRMTLHAADLGVFSL